MKISERAIHRLNNLAGEEFFSAVAKGVPLIVKNALSLNDAARDLHIGGQIQASHVVRGIAEEEAAKVLILIDAVRCPSEFRARTLSRCYSHIPKRIYAAACTYPGIATFEEFSNFVELERQPYFLDGPNDFDWIVPNSFKYEREQVCYVDYVQDVTVDDGECWWRIPCIESGVDVGYEIPGAVSVAEALSNSGACNPLGLSIIHDIWRDFDPVPETGRDEVREVTKRMLFRLTDKLINFSDDDEVSTLVFHWSFPLWPIDFNQETHTVKQLRALRSSMIDLLEKTSTRRDPRPQIERKRVEELHTLYVTWYRDKQNLYPPKRKGGPTFIPAEVAGKMFEMESYRALVESVGKLTEVERIALLALAWYKRERLHDRPYIYNHAKRSRNLDDHYVAGTGFWWLGGLEKWEEKPRPFSAGQMR